MFGTVAKWRMKPGAESWLAAQEIAMRNRPAEGWISTTIYRDRDDPQVIWAAVVFESEETYRSYSDSPLTNTEYERILSAMEGPPEWHDGDVLMTLSPDALRVSSQFQDLSGPTSP